MSRTRPHPVPVRRALTTACPIRMDTTANPYGPSVYVQEALAGAEELHLPAGHREIRLHLRLAHELGFSPDWLMLANGLGDLLDALLLRQRVTGPVVVFPPTDPAAGMRAEQLGVEVREHRRAAWYGLEVRPDDPTDPRPGAMAYVLHPNDPSGTLLGNQSLVRLTRRCALVVVDERHAGYSGRTFAPYIREFDNLIVLQSFETWAGLAGLPFAYAIAPPPLITEIAPYLRPGGVAMGAVIGAQATLDDLDYVRATVGRVREERSRLYRMLRKLNVLTPVPSVANFVLARVERGSARSIAGELAARDIRVHLPEDRLLEHHLRFSAGNPESTDALKRALIEIAAGL